MTAREITYAIQARNLLIEGKLEKAYVKSRIRIRELEAENADLKRQKDEAISYILSKEGASMIDCRICSFNSSCEHKPQQREPNCEMCLRAVRKYIEQDGE